MTIHVAAFLTAFSLGLLFVYLSRPKPQIVIKFPSPYNAGHVYRESSGDACFRYKATRVTCAASAQPQPIMEPFRGRATNVSPSRKQQPE